MANVEELEKKIKEGRRPSMLGMGKTEKGTKGDELKKKLKSVPKIKGVPKKVLGKKKTFESPMKMERKKEGYRSKVQKAGGDVRFMDEMDAMTKGLKTLTSEGPGRLKVGSFSKGGRAGYRMGGKCKLAKKGKGRAYGKNS